EQAAIAHFQMRNELVGEADFLDGIIEADGNGVILEPTEELVAVKPAQGHYWNLHLKTASVPLKTVPKNFARIALADSVGRFVHRARKHQTPKAIYHSLGLPVILEPSVERGVRVDLDQLRQAVNNPEFLSNAEKVSHEKASR